MADRMFTPPLGHLEVGVVELYCAITVGASGAVASYSGKGVASVVKETSAGQYTITLTDRYPALLWPGATLLDDSDSAATAVGIGSRFQAAAVSSATPTVTVQMYALDDGADANPADGAVIYVCLKLKNSSV